MCPLRQLLLFLLSMVCPVVFAGTLCDSVACERTNFSNDTVVESPAQMLPLEARADSLRDVTQQLLHVDANNEKSPTAQRGKHQQQAADTIARMARAVQKGARNAANTIFIPDANKSVWLSVAFPGLGQIYNRSYWKVPIVYACVAGSAFAITRFSLRYNDYMRGYQELVDNDPTTNYYVNLVPDGYPESQAATYITNQLEVNRRYRDFAIVAGVAVYALQIIEAFVDAQLKGFDISPDLSMKVTPALSPDPNSNCPAVGGSIKLQF